MQGTDNGVVMTRTVVVLDRDDNGIRLDIMPILVGAGGAGQDAARNHAAGAGVVIALARGQGLCTRCILLVRNVR